MKRLFVAIIILFCSLPIMASLSLRNIYYTHNDHLGSSAWITASDGCPIQYLHYLPYGQLVANQQMIGYDERFKFLGKERDLESGYDYLGARFYASPFKHFISPEPLLDKYLHISPYSYAAWNPVRFIDRDGRVIAFAPGTTSAQKRQFWQAIRHLNSHNCGGRFGQLRKSKYTYTINMNVQDGQFFPNEQTINWNPEIGIETTNGTIISPATVLNHEMTHATRYDTAVKQYNSGNEESFKEYEKSLAPDASNQYGSLEEQIVITGNEQRTAQALGEVKSGQVTRTDHRGTPVRVESPISTKKVEE